MASGFVGGAYLEGWNGGYSSHARDYKINKRLADNLKDMGVTMQFAGRDLMRTYVNNLIRLTWPKNKKTGDAAIASDMRKVFVALDQPDAIAFFESEFGTGSTTSGNVLKGAKRRRAASGKLPGVEFNWRGDQQQMKSWLDSRRGNNGRVKERLRVAKRVGKLEFANGMYVPRSAAKRFYANAKRHVAICKAGWMPAANYFASKTGGRNAAPAFVLKQALQTGTKQDAFKVDGSGFATATNLVPWSSRLTNWVIRAAEDNAEAYMAKATKKQAEKIAERFNKVK